MGNSSPFSEPLYIMIFICSLVSLCLGFTLISLAFFTKKQVSYTFKLILNLIFVSMLHSIAYCFHWNNQENDTICKIQASLLIFTTLSEELWLTIITYTTYTILNPSNDINNKNNRRNYFLYGILCYVLPFSITALYLSLEYLGQSSYRYYCWIDDKMQNENHYIKGFLLYLHKWINCFIVIFFSIKTIMSFKQMDFKEDKSKKDAMSVILRVLIFPLIQVLTAIIPTLNIILIGCNYHPEYLKVPTLISGASHGLIYPLVYLSFENVRKALICQKENLRKTLNLNKSMGSLYDASEYLNGSNESSKCEISLHET